MKTQICMKWGIGKVQRLRKSHFIEYPVVLTENGKSITNIVSAMIRMEIYRGPDELSRVWIPGKPKLTILRRNCLRQTDHILYEPLKNLLACEVVEMQPTSLQHVISSSLSSTKKMRLQASLNTPTVPNVTCQDKN